MKPGSERDPRQPFMAKMQAENMPREALDTFSHHFDQLVRDSAGTIGRDDIQPVESLPDSESLEGVDTAGAEALERVVIIKLNGGLGTGMGLARAKSLLEVRSGLTFLDLIARQTIEQRRTTRSPIPLLLMNSFRTAADTDSALARHPDLEIAGLPLGFIQHRIPKIVADGMQPAQWERDPDLEWCPPGHGDLYTALVTSSVLDTLLRQGYEYAFVSNADNLGAVLDQTILGYMAAHRLPFMMEVSDRTGADRKGGHLCRLADGRLALRELAQCPSDEIDDFQNIQRYRFFNTNNLWLHLPSVRALIDSHAGVMPLATIINRKTLDPRDPGSPEVVQLETAMGSAISLFENAHAIRVPRRRFSPVKNTNDLLGVRSDAFRLTDDGRIVLAASRTAPPVITLDGNHFKLIDDFETRFPHGPPSLLACDALTVEGDVTFGSNVRIVGNVRITGRHEPAQTADNTTLTGHIEL
jgi:UTP--glucose-1-phosphate uridylyltransferase